MTASAWSLRISQASSETSPQARPAMSVSRSPSPRPACRPAAVQPAGRAVGVGQHDRGRVAPQRRTACAATAAAMPPTPVCRKMWVGGARQRLERLGGHQLVALHHVARDVGIARDRRCRRRPPSPRAARSPRPRARCRRSCRRCAGPRRRRLDGALAPLRDGGVDEDHAAAAEALRAPGDRAAVVAVGRAGRRSARRRHPRRWPAQDLHHRRPARRGARRRITRATA
jgi:hypothetical protein